MRPSAIIIGMPVKFYGNAGFRVDEFPSQNNIVMIKHRDGQIFQAHVGCLEPDTAFESGDYLYDEQEGYAPRIIAVLRNEANEPYMRTKVLYDEPNYSIETHKSNINTKRFRYIGRWSPEQPIIKNEDTDKEAVKKLSKLFDVDGIDHNATAFDDISGKIRKRNYPYIGLDLANGPDRSNTIIAFTETFVEHIRKYAVDWRNMLASDTRYSSPLLRHNRQVALDRFEEVFKSFLP